MDKVKKISVRFSDKESKELFRYAARNNLCVSDIIRKAVSEYVYKNSFKPAKIKF